jgi:hypothetical protein
VTQQADASFPLNGPSLALEPLLGVWNTEGVHGLIPDTVLHGRTSFERMQPGGLVRMHSRIHEDVGIPEGVAVFGSDDAVGTFAMVYYDARGVSRIQNVSVEGNVLTWWRDAPGFAQRYSLTLADDGRTMVGKGELCRDGSTWEQDLDLTYTRVEE